MPPLPHPPSFLDPATLGHGGAQRVALGEGEGGAGQGESGSVGALDRRAGGVEVAEVLALGYVFAAQGELDAVEVAPFPESFGERGGELGAEGSLGGALDREGDDEGGAEGIRGVDLGEQRWVAFEAAVEEQQAALGRVGRLAGEDDVGPELAGADQGF